MGGNPTRFVLFARSVDFKTEGEAREGGMKTRSGGEEGGDSVSFTYILADNF